MSFSWHHGWLSSRMGHAPKKRSVRWLRKFEQHLALRCTSLPHTRFCGATCVRRDGRKRVSAWPTTSLSWLRLTLISAVFDHKLWLRQQLYSVGSTCCRASVCIMYHHGGQRYCDAPTWTCARSWRHALWQWQDCMQGSMVAVLGLSTANTSGLGFMRLPKLSQTPYLMQTSSWPTFQRIGFDVSSVDAGARGGPPPLHLPQLGQWPLSLDRPRSV
mmetsp:Transcript_80498/g.159419  ORF Transcript_80498/g.159419 Transcript_80498/m.159419 type:complete len:216 (-) Transcript_80498:85-732(-)